MLNYTSNHLSRSVARMVCIGIAAKQEAQEQKPDRIAQTLISGIAA